MDSVYIEEDGAWRVPAHGQGYAYERCFCGHVIAVVEIPLAGIWLTLIDGEPAGFASGGLGQIEQNLEEKVRFFTGAQPPWDGEERRRVLRRQTLKGNNHV